MCKSDLGDIYFESPVSCLRSCWLRAADSLVQGDTARESQSSGWNAGLADSRTPGSVAGCCLTHEFLCVYSYYRLPCLMRGLPDFQSTFRAYTSLELIIYNIGYIQEPFEARAGGAAPPLVYGETEAASGEKCSVSGS